MCIQGRLNDGLFVFIFRPKAGQKPRKGESPAVDLKS